MLSVEPRIRKNKDSPGSFLCCYVISKNHLRASRYGHTWLPNAPLCSKWGLLKGGGGGGVGGGGGLGDNLTSEEIPCSSSVINQGLEARGGGENCRWKFPEVPPSRWSQWSSLFYYCSTENFTKSSQPVVVSTSDKLIPTTQDFRRTGRKFYLNIRSSSL